MATVRKRYSYDKAKARHLSAAPHPSGNCQTVQDEKENCDINVICERFGLTERMPPQASMMDFRQFDGVFDFQSAMNVVTTAQREFDALPAKMRERFGNNPQNFLDYCTALNEDGTALANVEELRKLGLAVPETVVVKPSPTEVIVVNTGEKDGKS